LGKGIGFVLGGGGARGLAHIGVLSVLEGAGIRPDVISGTSAGAIVGLIYAAGATLDELRELARGISSWRMVRFSLRRGSLLSLRPARRLLSRWLEGRRIEDLEIPCVVTATDLQSGERVALTEGPALEAALACSAVPAVYPPVEWGGRILVDGGLTGNVPVQDILELGAEKVVAVTLGFVAVSRDSFPLFGHVGLQALDLMGKRLTRPEEEMADVLLRPDVERLSVRAWGRGSEFLRAGEEEARRKLPEIRCMLGIRAS
jgi:NTE family protein